MAWKSVDRVSLLYSAMALEKKKENDGRKLPMYLNYACPTVVSV